VPEEDAAGANGANARTVTWANNSSLGLFQLF